MFQPSYSVADFRVTPNDAISGLFEPASGVLFLNVDDERFDDWRRNADPVSYNAALAEVFFHEIYHCLQTYATGFAYAYCQRIVETYIKHVSRDKVGQIRLVGPKLAAWYVDYPLSIFDFLRSPWSAERRSRARLLRAEARYVDRLSRRSEEYGEPSVAGAIYPDLCDELRAIREAAAARGPDGLSGVDIVEGSAFVYGRERVRATGDSLSHLRDGSLDPDGPYQRVIDAASGVLSEWDSQAVLAACALALRYERPGDAFLPLLERFRDRRDAQGSASDALTLARTLALERAAIPTAGQYLGTAADYHAKTRSRNKTYAVQLKALKSGAWGIDELDLLTKHEAFERNVPTEHMGPTTLVTRSWSTRGYDRRAGGSIVVAAYLLPDGPKVARLRRDLRLQTSALRDDQDDFERAVAMLQGAGFDRLSTRLVAWLGRDDQPR